VTLEVGGLTEQITVVAESPVLQTTTATATRRLGAEEIVSAPSSTRNFTPHLLTAAAGNGSATRSRGSRYRMVCPWPMSPI
jgi:hypothetical protein